jgi:hypothetical protein
MHLILLQHAFVVAGVPPAVEGWRLAARTRARSSIAWNTADEIPPGGDARLYGRRDACRHTHLALAV